MKSVTILAAAAAFAIVVASAANAGCGLSGGNVNILGNDFAAIHAVVEGAKTCAGDGVTVEANLTAEHDKIKVAAFTADPAQYTTAHVATSSIVPLLSAGLIRPLDDLVAKHGQGLKPTQLIKVDGKTMAIAFMSNAQHLFYRKDLLAKAGIEPPKTYEEVLAAARKLKEDGILEHPFAMNTKAGWNLGEEFVNMYNGTGASFFKDGTAEVAINNENGIKTLNMLKELMAYSSPDFLTFDSNASAAEWEAGNLALATLWGSRGGPILDNEGSTEEITSNTVLTGAPTAFGGSTPATTLWWDGFVIAKNISDQDAEASFVAMMQGITPEVIKAHSADAVWLGEGYTPTPASAGVIASAQAGAKPYPMLPYMSLLHTALGDNLAQFLQGSETAEQALADVEAAYTTAAKEAGFLK